MSSAVRGCGFGGAPSLPQRTTGVALSAQIGETGAGRGGGCRCLGYHTRVLGMTFRPRAAHVVPFRPVGLERAPKGSPQLANGSHEIPPHDRFLLAVPRRGFRARPQCGRDLEAAALP